MEQILLKLYEKHFTIKADIGKYLKAINYDINNAFSKEQIDFFIKGNEEKLDLMAFEYHLRKKQKDNIFSFIFLRLSSLAESTVENQKQYINKSKASVFKIFIVLSMAAINTIVMELKGLTLGSKIKEYLCMT